MKKIIKHKILRKFISDILRKIGETFATARDEKWAAFQADPEWIEKRAETEAEGPIVQTVSNLILQPTSFSSVK